MHRALVLSLCLVLLSAPLSQAQWSVYDAPASVQRSALWVEEAIQWAASLANQAKEIEATYNVILQEIKQYELMIVNLKRMPEGLNVVEAVTLWSQALTGLLSNATMLSYNITSVAGQFTELYVNLGQMGSVQDVFTLRTRLLGARTEASAMTVQVTAIQSQMTEMYARMCALLQGAYTAEGNLNIEQVQAMELGIIQHTQEAQALIQATHARVTAQREAEQAVMERLELQAIQGAMRDTTPTTFTPQGQLPRKGW
jgi:hypothetical protein